MRLLYVCNDFGIKPDGTKGASVHLRAITAALARQGHEILLLSPHPGPGPTHPAKRLLPPGCPAVDEHVASLRRWMKSHALLDSGLTSDLRPLSYNAWAAEQAIGALAGHKPDAIIERLGLHSTLGLDLAQMLGIPLILEVNALLSEEAESFRTLALKDLARSIELMVLKQADHVAVVSEALRQRLISMGIAPDRIEVVVNGSDVEAFALSSSSSVLDDPVFEDNAFVVGFVGSLKAWHGVDLLLQAFAIVHKQLPDARLMIVGSGPEESTLRSMAAHLGLDDAVAFCGAVDHGMVPAHIHQMDVAVAPYRHRDDFYFSPIKLFEYMAAGCCTIAANIGQIPEVIDHGRTGLLFSAGDQDELVARILEAYRSPDDRLRIGQNATHLIRTRYTWDHAAKSIERLVTQAITLRLASGTESQHFASTSREVRHVRV